LLLDELFKILKEILLLVEDKQVRSDDDALAACAGVTITTGEIPTIARLRNKSLTKPLAICLRPDFFKVKI
jgi:hypothetical protein